VTPLIIGGKQCRHRRRRERAILTPNLPCSTTLFVQSSDPASTKTITSLYQGHKPQDWDTSPSLERGVARTQWATCINTHARHAPMRRDASPQSKALEDWRPEQRAARTVSHDHVDMRPRERVSRSQINPPAQQVFGLARDDVFDHPTARRVPGRICRFFFLSPVSGIDPV